MNSSKRLSLNIGAGNDERGDVKLDIVAIPGIDVRGDMHRLPFTGDSFDEVRLDHTLEHAQNPVVVLEEIYRVCRDGARVHISVPHGFTVRGIRDPTHETYYSVRSIEHFCSDQSYLPDWYSDASFRLEHRKIVAGPPNDIREHSALEEIIRIGSYFINRAIVAASNQMPEVFEPLLSLTSRADITWELKVDKSE